jgi:di/tripeptidase
LEVSKLQDMIKRIIEADNQAKALEEENRKSAELQKQKIEEDAAAIYQKYMDDAKAEIEKSDAYIEKRTERKLMDIEAKHESALIKLKSDYEQNRERWVDEIVGRVVG